MARPWEVLPSPELDVPAPNEPAPGSTLGPRPWEIDIIENNRRTQRNLDKRRQDFFGTGNISSGVGPYRRLAAGGRLLLRGIPIVGNAFEHTDDSRELAAVSPGHETTANFLAGLGPFGLASKFISAARIPFTASRIGTRAITDIPAQAALGGGVAAADSAAAGNRSGDNLINGLFGGGLGTVGGTIGRIRAPGGITYPRPKPKRGPQPTPPPIPGGITSNQPRISSPPPNEGAPITGSNAQFANDLEDMLNASRASSGGDDLARQWRTRQGINERMPGATPESEEIANAALNRAMEAAHGPARLRDRLVRRNRTLATNTERWDRFVPPLAGMAATGAITLNPWLAMLAGPSVYYAQRAAKNLARRQGVRNYLSREVTPSNAAIFNSPFLSAGELANEIDPRE